VQTRHLPPLEFLQNSKLKKIKKYTALIIKLKVFLKKYYSVLNTLGRSVKITLKWFKPKFVSKFSGRPFLVN
jgi:hypothetical protein